MAAKRRALAERRKAVGHTQEQLAELLGVERSTVVRWEAGETEPLPLCRPKLAEALALSVDELHGLLTDIGVQEQPNKHVERKVPFDPMRRRTFVKWSFATTAATGLGIESTAKVSSADVARLQHTTARLYRLADQHGGETLWQAAAARVNEGYLILERNTYSSSIGQQLLMTTGRLQVCAGWLAFDAGQDDAARACYEGALALARQADDSDVEIRALANLARQSYVLGRPREAQRLATAAEHVAVSAGGSSRLAVITQLRKAVASSLIADASEAARAITQARRALDRDRDEPTEEWCAFLSPAEVDGIEATCALELGWASRAESLLEQAVASYGNQYARNRALYRVRLARARLDMKAVDGAAEAANGALDDLSGELASWRVSSELDDVARRLADYPAVTGVESFLTQWLPCDELPASGVPTIPNRGLSV